MAKIPVGYYVSAASNSIGTGGDKYVLGDKYGTGEWKEYSARFKYGSSGTIGTTGFIALCSTDTAKYPVTSVTWYLAYVCMYDVTDNPEIETYPTMPSKKAVLNNNTVGVGILNSTGGGQSVTL